MNPSMWLKALRIIPHVSKEEWQKLDTFSHWLIATRAAVLIMTFLSAAFAGIFAFQAGNFNWFRWILLALGLVLAHATNNLLNDYTDFTRGVDQDNYYRAQYGPQPLVHGLLTKRQLLTYAAVTGLAALACGIPLVLLTSWWTLLLMGLGVFFVLFYTWPLKYIALGEITVLLVWGPLMIGGGYFAITGNWDWSVVLASLPYALGVTGVIFGKHIDKYEADKIRKIYTLPVVIGEKSARVILVAIFMLQYLFTFYLIITGFLTWVMLAILIAVPSFLKIWPMFKAPKPEEKPADFPDVWPNYFVAAAFYHNRSFGIWFLLALIVDSIIPLL